MFSYRPAVRAPRAMVASAHPLATEAGLAILRAGGGAIDAGLAVNACLNVTQVPCCGFGGDAFFLYFDAAAGELHAYNASGRAPAGATIETVRALGHDQMPGRGPVAVTVPGMAEGWATLHQRFGKLPWSELFAPAIGYARDGFPVSDKLAGWIRGAQEVFRHWPSSAAAMLPDGHPPQHGATLRQPDLAATFEQVAKEGAATLYHGAVADEIGRSVTAAGGLLNAQDLAAHSGHWSSPVGVDYHGYRILVHGPNSQGWTLPYMLGLVADRDLRHLKPAGTAMVHLGVEAKRLAFADRDAYNTDPEAMPVAAEQLLSPEYLSRRRQALSDDRAMPDPHPGTPEGDTTYFCVVDEQRNCLSVIQSLFHGFGSGFVAGRTGLFLQNRGHYFSLDPQHVNALAPGKRTAHTLISAMVLRDGRPVIVPGSMGGDGQPQILYQILTRMLDLGLNPQQAIEQPRWVHGQRDGEVALHLESRYDAAVVEELRHKGHRIELLADWADLCGHAQVIAIDEHGLCGGADPRGDGQAAGY